MRQWISVLTAVSVLAAPAVFAGEDKAACSETCDSKTVAQKAGLHHVALQVGGLDCEVSCGSFQKTLTGLKGVAATSVCAVSKTAKISYDAKEIDRKELFAAILKAGYTVNSQHLALQVKGLSCDACVTKVSKALAGLKGIQQKDVCHVSKNAKIAFDPAKVSEEQVLAAISTAGFKAEPAPVVAE